MPTDRTLTATEAAIPFALVPTLTPAEVERLRTAFAARPMAAPTRRALLSAGEITFTDGVSARIPVSIT